MAKPELLLFDWDGVIFNYHPLKKVISESLVKAGVPEEVLPELYILAKGNNYGYTHEGHATVVASKFPRLKKNVQEMFRALDVNSSRYVFSDARNFISTHSQTYSYGVLTAGDPEFQRQKINQSGLAEKFKEIIVVPYTTAVQTKIKTINGLLARYPHILYFDDRLEIIEAIAKTFPASSVAPLWFNREKLKLKPPRGVQALHSFDELDLKAIFPS